MTGPVDLAVIHFKDSQFNGDIAPALLELHDEGIVHIEIRAASGVQTDRFHDNSFSGRSAAFIEASLGTHSSRWKRCAVVKSNSSEL